MIGFCPGVGLGRLGLWGIAVVDTRMEEVAWFV